MRWIFAGVLLLNVWLLTGCAKYWYQEGRSFQQTRKDLTSCQSEAIRYSDVERTHGLGSYERHFVGDCMHEKGYRLVGEKELPVRVKRESLPVFGMPGVAGTID